MQIRAITVGADLQPGGGDGLGAWARAARDLKGSLETHGYPVQTLRLAGQPLDVLMAGRPAKEAPGLAAEIERDATAAGVDYCSLGPVRCAGAGPVSPLVAEVPAVLRATERVFLSVSTATTAQGVNIGAVREAAAALVDLSSGDAEGFRALRFALSANVPPHGPFFPSAYHEGPGAGFSIALEAADLAVDAFDGARSLAAAEAALVRSLNGHGTRVRRLAEETAHATGLQFHGMDISLAPFPEEARSIGAALERLGVARFGASGTLFAASFLTGVLAKAALPTCGFSGLMLPLLEDAVMAARHAEGAYSLDSLLLYSAVCGAGLDTIPVPGDATADEIASVYLDVCALSVALDKPLTARLMPLAGKQAGDPVTFAFPYFAPTRVVRLGPASGRLLEQAGWIRSLGARRPR